LVAACLGLVVNFLPSTYRAASAAVTPQLTIDDVSVNEGDTGSSVATFTVTLSASQSSPVTVAYTVADGTATQPSDYVGVPGNLTFAPGQTTRPITVTVSGDTFPEPNETFAVVLSNPIGATIADGTGDGTIVNDDGTAPSLAIGDSTVTEGNTGTSVAHFTITRTNAPATEQQTVTVDYATADGTAKSASGDYTPTSGTLTFAATDTTKTVDVTITGDTKNEANETFFVNLSNPQSATITDSQGRGTITNDDTAPTLAIADATANEGSGGGTTTFTFPVTLSAASGRPVSVDYSTANGTAKATDYTAKSGTLLFNEGDLSKNITVTVAADNVNEADETFTVNLANPTNATIDDAQGLGTISNDDADSSLIVSDATVIEGNSGTVAETFTVTLSAPSDQTVTVAYATSNDTATAPADFVAATGTVTFAPGDTSKSIIVQVKGDALNEANETYFVDLSTPSNATIEHGHGIGTITDDDNPPELSIGNATGSEGDGTASFTVTLAPASGSVVTVDYNTVAGTATAGSDFTPKSGTLTFQPGDTTKAVNVNILQDTLNEADETFTVHLANPSGAAITTANGTGTIVDDDAEPGLAISSDTTPEGDTGTTNGVFTITLSPASTKSVTVAYATADGTATAPSDYTATTGTATFAPGETTRDVNVPIVGDTTPEFNETFAVNLATPTNATITDGQGTETITNDDGPPASISIGDDTVAEGDAGTVDATLTVSLAAPSTSEVTVHYATADATAKEPGDYTATSGDLTFAPGDTTKTVTVPVVGDLVDEINEHFVVNLTGASANAVIADPQGTATITDNDAPADLSVDNVTVTEGNTGTVNATFTVTLAPASEKTVTVHYATANGTATQPGDYAPTSGDLTFAPNETSKTVDVPVAGDVVDETNETFALNLTTPSNATLADGVGQGTITDDDGQATLSVNDVAVTEGDSATTPATFTVTLSTASGQPVTVHYATANATATQPGDYTPTSGDLTFAAGETTKSVAVPVVGDTAHEATETFVLNLTAPTNATLADGVGQATITDNDAVVTPPTVAPQITTGADAGGGPHVRNFVGALAGTPTVASEFFAYETSYGGGVRVARGDFDLDGRDEIVTASGPGHAPIVRVWSASGALLNEFAAYGSTFGGGVFVAVGDVTGDAHPEIITGAGAGGGPHVRVFSQNGSEIIGFFAYGTDFTGGVTVGAGNVLGTKANIVTGAGPGGAPHVRIFDGSGIAVGGFFAYDQAFAGGVYVAAGGGRVVTGPGAGGGPNVKVFDATGSALSSFFAYDQAFGGGVRVAAGNLDGTAGPEIVTGPGAGGAPHVKTFGLDGVSRGGGFFAYGTTFSGGIFVAAGTA
jgi:hypothetical protein